MPPRSYVTLLFADLCHSTRLASMMEAEEYLALLHMARASYHGLIAAHGGTVAQVSGDGLLAVFGHAGPSEDDPHHAIDAALALHARVAGLRGDDGRPLGLAMHSGIHSGFVLIQPGDIVHGRLEALGSATNLASRLASAAGEDEILVSAATLGPKRAAYHTTARDLPVRGWPAPVPVLRIHGRAAASAVRGGAPFVGRDRQLAALLAGLDRTIKSGRNVGGPVRIAIVGTQGVGKSRLAEELLARAVQRGCRTARAECTRGGGAPFQPLRDLADAITAGDTIDASVTDAPAPDLAATAKPAAATPPATMFAATLDRAAAAAPLVLLIDDWQWADDATRQFVATHAAAGGRMMIVLASRIAPDAFAGGTEIVALPPFTECEALASVGQLLASIDPFTARQISIHSGGNPLFIEELCHAVRAGAGRDWGERPADGRGWLDMLIATRFAQLPADQADPLRTCAVIGASVPGWLFTRITGLAATDPPVAALAAADFLFLDADGETLRFKHGVARDAIYNGIGLHHRRDLHAALAAVLEERAAASNADFTAELAGHHQAAGNHRAAAGHAELAGDRALAASALDRAQLHYRTALAALDRLPDEGGTVATACAIAQRLGLATVFDPSRDHLAVLQRVIDRARAADDAAGAACVDYWLGYVTYALGDARAAVARCDAALPRIAALGLHDLHLPTTTLLGQACAASGDHARALPLLDHAVEQRRPFARDPRTVVGFAYALACRAAVLADLGRFDEAHDCFDEALEAIRGANHEVEGSVLCWRAAVCLWQGRPKEAHGHAAAAAAVAERVHSIYVFSMARALGAYAAWMIGAVPEALKTLSAATSWLSASGRGLFVSLNHGWMADALVTAGRFGEARDHAAHALAHARCGDRLGAAMACRAMARAAARGHGKRLPEHYLRLAEGIATVRASPHEAAANRLCAATLALDRGAGGEATRLLAEAEHAFAAHGMAWHRTEAQQLRERAARPTSRA